MKKIKSIILVIPGVRLIYKFLAYTKHHGVKNAIKKVKQQLNIKKRSIDSTGFFISETQRRKQKAEKFKRCIKLSVFMPVHSTEYHYIEQSINSVTGQTYENWELLLVDTCDGSYSQAEDICQQYQKQDSRIKYKKTVNSGRESRTINEYIERAFGDYCVILKQGDLLHPTAFYEVAKEIYSGNADFIYTDEAVFQDAPNNVLSLLFKPDFAADTLRNCNYISNLSVFRKSLLGAAGSFNDENEDAYYYDMVLRLTEKAHHVRHVAKVLYYKRHSKSAPGDAQRIYEAEKRAVSEHLKRVGMKGTVGDGKIEGTYRIRYEISGSPLVSIIIPNKDNRYTLAKCISSICDNSTYRNFEIIIIENSSAESETFEYYNSISSDNIRVITWEHSFNFALLMNYGARHAQGDYCLYLNNDTEVITPSWIEEMLMYSQRPDVGAVGAKLYYPDGRVQHAGMVLGMSGSCAHLCHGFEKNETGYMARLQTVQNVSLLTGACMMVKKSLHEKVGGWDAQYAVYYNDVDFCMKLRSAGYLNIFTPYAELYHHEGRSLAETDTSVRMKRHQKEELLFCERWSEALSLGDSYYNPNLPLNRNDVYIADLISAYNKCDCAGGKII